MVQGRTSARGKKLVTAKAKHPLTHEQIIEDYRVAYRSRLASLVGRREVLTGKAKFGIFGDGKEVAQVAMAKAFREGDWRSGYYRDQTFMFATGMATIREFWAQLYADSDVEHDPFSGGRQMGSHFATRILDDEGGWLPTARRMNSSADLSSTGGQMARVLGLAYASKLYRNEPSLKSRSEGFSVNGNEVAFGTIGNASTSEGIFWETMNAAGVLQVPLAMSVWDDGYGISVPNELQTIKSSISAAMQGFKAEAGGSGMDIYVERGWDYLALCDMYLMGVEKVRRDHVPALFHVTEVTQPQGHSTSGSHERYKSKERLQFEADFDCNRRMRDWIVAEGIASTEQLEELEAEDKKFVDSERRAAWEAYQEPIRSEQSQLSGLLVPLQQAHPSDELTRIVAELADPPELNRKTIQTAAMRALIATRMERSPQRDALADFVRRYDEQNRRRYQSYIFSESADSPLNVEERKPVYSENSELVDGSVVLVRFFDHAFKKDARLFAIGEDVGKLGDVNKVYDGLNAKYGDLRLTDTGIREATILGQGIGAALRGLRPIVDIQYLDYLIYALQGMSDDLATLHYRSAGGQKAPVVIRTKGHRLQGIWHTGSPMAMILHSCRGMYVCVPRDMTRAAGMYNTLFQGDNPAMVVEVLSGYYLKEKVPDNVGSFTVPLGRPEVLRRGRDVSIVTYGACCRIASDAAAILETMGIDIEVIDVQTLSPFDIDHSIASSVRKTNAVIFLDEDVPGGASAFMMQEVLEVQGAWHHLDSAPRTLAASEGRSAYATDGQYYTKPSVEDVVRAAYEIMAEREPTRFPSLL